MRKVVVGSEFIMASVYPYGSKRRYYYGLRIPIRKRQIFVGHKDVFLVFVEDGNKMELIKIKISPSFWKKCPELTGMELNKWISENIKWTHWKKGNPPKFLLFPVHIDDNLFLVLKGRSNSEENV